MTQDKAPEWAVKAAEEAAHTICNTHHIWGTLGDDGVSNLTETIALALSQAYERGQESMRERAAVATETRSPDDDNLDYQVRLQATTAIRSLPIEQENK